MSGKRVLLATFIAALGLLVLFSAAAADTALSAKEQLGKSIFFDENLSINQNQSCAACHGPEVGFTGPEPDKNAG